MQLLLGVDVYRLKHMQHYSANIVGKCHYHWIRALNLEYRLDPHAPFMQEWPNDLIPEIPIGKMVLDKNVDNFFNESEVYAVDPGVTVPGMQPFPTAY